MLKTLVRRFLVSSPMLPLWRVGVPSLVTILTMHRFAVPGLGVPGHDPAELAQALERLRHSRTPVMSLPDLLAALAEDRPLPHRSVVFTIDDGYFDFAEVAAPVFAAYDCPATVFLVTGFLDGDCWLWWDQVRHLLVNGDIRRLQSELVPSPKGISDAASRAEFAASVCTAATRIPHVEIERIIAWLSRETGAELPASPPDAFKPMTWDSVRSLASQGFSFGPHTSTHPVLTNVPVERVGEEVRGSWRRLQEALPNALPVFAYPNGDYGEREVRAVATAGLRAAVTTAPAYLRPAPGEGAQTGLITLPRFPYPDHSEQLLLTASGFRRLQPAPRLPGGGRRA